MKPAMNYILMHSISPYQPCSWLALVHTPINILVPSYVLTMYMYTSVLVIGDITPKYTGEVAYTILVVIIGFTLCAGIVANLVPLYAHHSFVRQKYENQVQYIIGVGRRDHQS